MTGYLFTLEGGEGAGKSTQLRRLEQRLIDEGHEVSRLKFYEPGGTELADTLRVILKRRFDTDYAKNVIGEYKTLANHDIDPMTQATLFLSARSDQFIRKVKPELEQGKIILLDRSIDSTTVYQGHAQNPDLIDWIRLSNEKVLDNAGIKIDKTIFLDVPVNQSLARVKERNEGADIFDDKEESFHNALREGFICEWHYCNHGLLPNHPQYKRIAMVDGTGDEEKVHERIYKILCPIINKK